MSTTLLSPRQQVALAADGDWRRARASGERVTLASPYRKGLLERRAWYGGGGANAAYEYRASALALEIWREVS